MRFANERLLDARVSLGMTQEEAARVLGVDVRTYRRYESGAVNAGGFDVRHGTRARLLARMAEELGIAPRELVVHAEPSTGGPHVLPPVARFVGREALIEKLRRWFDGDAPRVIALVAVGGAGKSSVAERVTPVGAFVWSFYQDPRVETFIEALGAPTGGSQLDRVEQSLREMPRLLVLDGLEVAQADGTRDRVRGEIEDPALKRLLRAIAAGVGRTKALVTTRFDPVDLHPWSGEGFEAIALPPLSPEESASLFERWGLERTNTLAERMAGHALSLAVVASYVAAGGRDDDLAIDLREASKADALARRLLAVLGAYFEMLAASEREVLSALAIFPSGATKQTLAGLPLETSARAIEQALARLSTLGLVTPVGTRFALHPFVAQFAKRELGEHGARLHESERKRLVASLSELPSSAPRDPATLDRIELLVAHTLGAGRLADAAELYTRALGGFANLGLALGDMTRGHRVTRSFGDEAPLEVLYDRGLYAGALGDLGGALAAYGRYCRRAEAAGALRQLTTGLRTTAYTERLAGELVRARVSIDASVKVARALGDARHVVRGLALLGAILTDAGELDEAAIAFARVREMGDDPVARRGVWEAELLIARGDLDDAEARTLRNFEICHARGWPGHVAHCALLLGTIAARKGDREAAWRRWSHVRSWTDQTGEVELVLGSQLLAAELGDVDQARKCADLADRLGYGTARARALALV